MFKQPTPKTVVRPVSAKS